MKTYELDIDGRHYSVTVNGIENGTADVQVNGECMTVQVCAAQGSVNSTQAGDIRLQGVDLRSTPPSPTVPPLLRRGQHRPEDESPQPAAAPSGVICSPLPGVILSVAVREGQKVRSGEKIAVLEAMKMENDILAESDGIVKKLFVSKGDSLLEGAKIALIEK